jgi:twinkle protein
MPESEFVRHGPCEKCGSSDAVGWYSDGHGVCFVCNMYFKGEKDADVYGSIYTGVSVGGIGRSVLKLTPLTTVFRAIPKRGLSEDAIRKYQIDVCMDKTSQVGHRYPYFRNGQHVANQIRKRGEKGFYWEGDTNGIGLFGQQLFQPGSAKSITVTEGALDAPSAWLLTNSRYPCVSVVSAAGALEQCRTNYEYLNSFDEIVLCFDNDEPKTRPDGTQYFPGQEAAKKVAEIFAPGKCRILSLSEGKDPSDYCQKGLSHDVFVKEWWKAPRYMPDGLVFGHDLWDGIINAPQPYCVPTPIEGLNRLIYGLRLGEMVTFTADPKIGKTSILKAIEYALLTNLELQEKGYGVGFMHLEEPKNDLAVGIMGLHVGKRLNLPDTPTSEEELRKAYDEVINTPRVVIWDHFGSNSVDATVNKIRHMSALGCKYIVLDHFSMLASDQALDERKKLDEIATRLKTLTVECDICLIGVIHQNRQGQIRGTAAFEQLSNIVIRLERDKLDKDPWRRNVMVVTVTENRFSGRTGPAAHLFYDDTTGIFHELDEEAIQKYEEGRSINDADIPF